MLNIGIIGNTGKVNQVIITYITQQPDLKISGIFVRQERTKAPSDYALFDEITALAKVSDAIIDFSSPELSFKLIKELSSTKIIYVCGTTGFSNEQMVKLKLFPKQLCLIYSANMSFGINLINELLKKISIKITDDFDCAIIEIHRKNKKDSPSGTALMLTETLSKGEVNHKIELVSLRMADNPAEHQIIFSDDTESFSINHRSLNRASYAKGAVLACKWGQKQQPGFYDMAAVLDL